MGDIRVIGGKWRRRRLSVPEGVRPTPNRIRETLFNWLRPYLNQAVCLDAFTGTGILGIEALSQGASYVYFNDGNTAALHALQKNLIAFNIPPTCYSLENFHLPQAIIRITQPVQLVFLDPPFYQNYITHLLPWLATQTWLAKDALIYVEHEDTYTLPGGEIYRQKTAGKVCYSLIRINSG